MILTALGAGEEMPKILKKAAVGLTDHRGWVLGRVCEHEGIHEFPCGGSPEAGVKPGLVEIGQSVYHGLMRISNRVRVLSTYVERQNKNTHYKNVQFYIERESEYHMISYVWFHTKHTYLPWV